MTSLTLSTAPTIANAVDGKWVVREVAKRVEFVLNGKALGDLVAITEIGPLDYQVTPFEHLHVDGAAVLAGEASFDSDAQDPSRVPLLVCSCGDLMCGALTVRVSRDDHAVAWTDWAWEDQYRPPLMLDSLTSAVFDADDYDRVIQEAVTLAAANVEPDTVMRVRAPGPWWRNIRRVAQERTDEQAMLGWLMAQAVAPKIGEAHGSYHDFLVSLDAAQDLIAGAASSKRSRDDRHRRAALQALLVVEDSEHRNSLPPETLNAVRWYLERLQS
ncbi:hypothetical protein BJ986_000057 [Phycicoccus badiiscoriae]|uniref:Uncharacterized protein n=1 Tax=Pedococcus badiiscoriae TaxID=642776 RepID=A0A852WAC8_9MICO|nr:hypothetical protein [Pedococcus badiiscoriae]NYG05570.1 hypothetical protein [Pedococcus badiiscoriae]